MMNHLTAKDGATVRQLARTGQLTGITTGLAPGYVQANLVVVPKALAFDFLLFCQRNPRPCPLLDVTDPGSPQPPRGAWLRCTDRYPALSCLAVRRIDRGADRHPLRVA